ncbi:hypothetical protein BGZ99_008031 [Dissophora globulifera]|uniref:DUF1764-domain-containing protein n=1 Tax=Dissophora globulifera TaxID=979702 RepID=A0A9P6RU55_9FUNG|nr:hypothetical protein BGZ99_008031 [Dissophora globulifera]
MPPKKTLKSVIPKSTVSKPGIKDVSKKPASKASEIDDIFSTGTISTSSKKSAKDDTASTPSRKEVKDSKRDGKKSSSKDPAITGSGQIKHGISTIEAQDDNSFLGESLDDSEDEDEEEVDEEQLMFDEDERNETEEAALIKLMAKKKDKKDGSTATKDQSGSKAPGVTTTTKPKSSAKVEAVVFNERPAAAAAAAAAVKIQKYKRSKDAEPDSDDELEKKAKRRTDDGLRLFDIHDLNIGKGGDTDQCPFECKCCF